MKIVSGDLIALALQGAFDVIVHGCNCMCMMEAGIAKAIRNTFPEAYLADQRTISGDRKKLGSISTATVQTRHGPLTVVNAYTQYHWYGDGPLVDYDAVASAFRQIKKRFSGKRIGYPKIGAGFGGGDWERIAAIIDTELAGEDHTLVVFRHDAPTKEQT